MLLSHFSVQVRQFWWRKTFSGRWLSLTAVRVIETLHAARARWIACGRGERFLGLASTRRLASGREGRIRLPGAREAGTAEESLRRSAASLAGGLRALSSATGLSCSGTSTRLRWS